MTEYAIVIEPAGTNWSAYSPDIPGCVAVGDTSDDCLEAMRSAIEAHLAFLREERLPLPTPSVRVERIKIAA